jgi:tetratricopeptide (TPR) repeat protein
MTTSPGTDSLDQGIAGAEGQFYRGARFPVKLLALVLSWLMLAAAAPASPGDDALERARNDEERLALIIQLVEEGSYAAAERALVQSGEVAELDPRWLNLHGLAVAGQGRHAEAIALYEAGLRRDPSLAELHRNLAISLVQAGGRGRALTEFLQATELDPDDADAWLGLCTLQIRLRRGQDARESWTRLKLLAPEDVRTWRARTELADLEADRAGQREAWSWLEQRVPDAESARRLGMLADDPAVALEHYLACFQRDPAAVDCREQATALALAAGRPADGVAWSEPALAALSEPGYLNLLLAALNSSTIDHVDAWVSERAPATAEAWGVVALVRRQQNRPTAAMEAVQAGLGVAETADLYNLLGVLRVEGGDRPGARRAWSRALEIDPGHAVARQNLAEHPEAP